MLNLLIYLSNFTEDVSIPLTSFAPISWKYLLKFSAISSTFFAISSVLFLIAHYWFLGKPCWLHFSFPIDFLITPQFFLKLLVLVIISINVVSLNVFCLFRIVFYKFYIQVCFFDSFFSKFFLIGVVYFLKTFSYTRVW